MSRSRFGGMRWGKLKSAWSNIKTTSASVDPPATIHDLAYTDAQGIWNLRSTTQFPKSNSAGGAAGGGAGGGGGSFDESSIGTPTNTYTGPTVFNSPSGTSDITVAIDMTATVNNNGVLVSFGGSAIGFTMILESTDQTIKFATNGGSGSGSFVPYYGETGTLYMSIDYSVMTVDVYWYNGTMNQILSVNINSSDYAGTATGGIGETGNSIHNVGTANDNTNYSGTITGGRLWSGTYFDFGTV